MDPSLGAQTPTHSQCCRGRKVSGKLLTVGPEWLAWDVGGGGDGVPGSSPEWRAGDP